MVYVKKSIGEMGMMASFRFLFCFQIYGFKVMQEMGFGFFIKQVCEFVFSLS